MYPTSNVSWTTATSSAAAWTISSGNPPPDDPPPAAVGATIPAPKPFPPGPLRWTARRLDQAEELTGS